MFGEVAVGEQLRLLISRVGDALIVFIGDFGLRGGSIWDLSLGDSIGLSKSLRSYLFGTSII